VRTADPDYASLHPGYVFRASLNDVIARGVAMKSNPADSSA
jgi:hypothetical protein